jgi:Holliday junction resolvase RusA-like endonuclease
MLSKFVFPLPPTLNEIIGTARSNVYASAKEKRAWTNRIAVECFGRKQFPDRVWVEFIWKIKNFRRDPDNISAAAKFVMDGLVEGGIIQDDSLKFIMSPVLHWYEKGEDLVQINIADHPIWNGRIIDMENLGVQESKQQVIAVAPAVLLPAKSSEIAEKEEVSITPIVGERIPEMQTVTAVVEVLEEEISYWGELLELADLINWEYERSLTTPAAAMLHARNAGEWLLRAQSLLPESEWLAWLNANCQVSEQSAKTYMAIAKSWLSVQKSSVHSPI